MPKITETAQEKSLESFTEAMQDLLAQGSFEKPVLVVGVNRKANVGNFENIDVFSGLKIPFNADIEDVEKFQEIATKISEIGFDFTSKETYTRYAKIKESSSNSRK